VVDARPTDDDEDDGGNVDVADDERSRLLAKLAARRRRIVHLPTEWSVVLTTFPKKRACFVVVNNCKVCRKSIHS